MFSICVADSCTHFTSAAAMFALQNNTVDSAASVLRARFKSNIAQGICHGIYQLIFV